MNTEGLKVMTTRFEGRGNINVAISRCIDPNDTSVPVACSVKVYTPQDHGMEIPDDEIWLDDITDLVVLGDAIAAYLDMVVAEQNRKGGDYGIQ